MKSPWHWTYTPFVNGLFLNGSTCIFSNLLTWRKQILSYSFLYSLSLACNKHSKVKMIAVMKRNMHLEFLELVFWWALKRYWVWVCWGARVTEEEFWSRGMGWCIRVLRRNKTNRICVCVCVCVCKERELVWGIGSRDCGGWTVPRSVISKLETQENQWCSSSLIPKAWTSGELMACHSKDW